MKRFIVSVLCTAVFFIGLGSLIETTSAKFKSDEKALALIAQARQAIGGDANIKNVRGMTIIGNSTHNVEAEGVSRTEQGSMEINFEFPGKFNRMVRIGNPNGARVEVQTQREVNLFVMKKDGDAVELNNAGEGKREAFVIKRNGSENLEDVKIEGNRKFIIKKDDGTTQEIKPGDGNAVIFERKSGDDLSELKTEDGDRIAVNREALKFAAGIPRQNEMLRMTVALLLSAPEGTDASYLYAGESSVDGFSCDVIEVQSAGSSFKLYLDKSSHLPRMLSYVGMPLMRVIKLGEKEAANAARGDAKVFVRNHDGKAEAVEHQLKFSDFRYVGGLQLPHRWTQTIGGKAGETTEITSYEINPANIAEKFPEPKVFIRQAKPQQQ